jgi:hypothetical protein
MVRWAARRSIGFVVGMAKTTARKGHWEDHRHRGIFASD